MSGNSSWIFGTRLWNAYMLFQEGTHFVTVYWLAKTPVGRGIQEKCTICIGTNLGMGEFALHVKRLQSCHLTILAWSWWGPGEANRNVLCKIQDCLQFSFWLHTIYYYIRRWSVFLFSFVPNLSSEDRLTLHPKRGCIFVAQANVVAVINGDFFFFFVQLYWSSVLHFELEARRK